MKSTHNQKMDFLLTFSSFLYQLPVPHKSFFVLTASKSLKSKIQLNKKNVGKKRQQDATTPSICVNKTQKEKCSILIDTPD